MLYAISKENDFSIFKIFENKKWSPKLTRRPNKTPIYFQPNGLRFCMCLILLILPDVLTRLFAGMDGQGPTGGIGLQAEVIMFNSVFLYTYISCLVGSVSATSGKTVKLPLIGDASDSQTR